MERKVSINQALDYEIRGSFWASSINSRRLQNLAAKYYTWKVSRKHSRYTKSQLAERKAWRSFYNHK